jgi:flagellar assembly protein FliH
MSSSRESALLRGPSAAQAAPYRDVLGRVPAAPITAPRPPVEDAPVPIEHEQVVERRTTIRRAADQPVDSTRPTFRLGDVYAEELTRLRERAHAEGYAAGFAEGSAAAEAVVAEAERQARERLTEVQARWERRLVSATAALGAAVRQLDEATVPVADEVRDSVLGAVTTLVEDLLGRELELTTSPGYDAVRRVLTLCPSDAPVVVRLHPDDLAEIPAEALTALPDSVSVLGDERVERAGAVAETGSQRIDAQIGAALERVQAVLRP